MLINRIAATLTAAWLLAAPCLGQQQKRQSTSPAVIPGPARVVAIASSYIRVEAHLDGDSNNNSSTTFAIGTSATGPFSSSAATQPVLSGRAAARTAIFGNGQIQPGQTYWIQISHNDPDGVAGVNPEVIGPVTTPAAGLHSISGVVTGPDGQSAPGVTVHLSGAFNATAQTDSTGAYMFSGLSDRGTYRVTPAGSFSPDHGEIDNLTADQGMSFQETISQETTSSRGAGVKAEAAGCSFKVSPLVNSIGSAGGILDVTVDATAAYCSWTSASEASWLSVSDSSKDGSGSALISVSSNPGPARSGNVEVAGQTVTVNQSKGSSCSYSLSKTSESFGSAGGMGFVIVDTTESACVWSAVSSAAWIKLLTGTSGSGVGEVIFTVAPNNSGAARSASIVIAGITLEITEAN